MKKPGLILIQIDGLGHTQFKRALKRGHLPFLAWLVKRRAYLQYRHYTGLPSNTPAVQGMLFYGVKRCVPAFGFRDSESGKVFNMHHHDSATTVENRLKEKGRMLLEGGGAYGDIFTGGAKEAHFCTASLGWDGFLKAASPLGAPVTVLLNLHVFIRAFFLTGIEFFLALYDAFRGIITGRDFQIELKFIPLRVMICVSLREVVAAAARLDISKGLPVIHANFAGYDEQAHHRGPKSMFAHWSLRGIDSAIRGIWKTAARSRGRDYAMFIYSDHGQEETMGYRELFGRSTQEAVNEVFSQETQFSTYEPYLRANLLKAGSRAEAASQNGNGPAPPGVVVTALGPLGHIYPPQPLSEQQKDFFAEKLVTAAHIPIVMTAAGPGKATVWNSEGKFLIPDQAEHVIEPGHPFFEDVARDLAQLCHHADAGAFVISGWRRGIKSVTFTHEQGSHAGPGPEETNGFALLPAGALPKLSGKVISTLELREAALKSISGS